MTITLLLVAALAQEPSPGLREKVMSEAELETLALQMKRWEEMIAHRGALLVGLEKHLVKARAKSDSIEVHVPQMMGRVTHVFADGPRTMLMVKRSSGLQNEVAVYLHSKTKIEYVGLSRRNRKPKSGYGVQAWMKEGSTDVLSRVKFVSEENYQKWKKERHQQRERLNDARREVRDMEEGIKCQQAEIRNKRYQLDIGRRRHERERAIKREAASKKTR